MIALAVSLSGGATAAVLITGKQVKDGSIGRADLTPTLRAKLDRARTPGPAGPMGPAGVAGPTGPRGDTGAVGPSDTYTGFSASGTVSSNPDPNVLVVGISTPAGSYIFQSNVILTNTGGAATTVTCRILAGGDTVDTATTSLGAAGGLDTQTLALAGTDDLGLSQNLSELLCSGPVDYADADFTATRVGSLR